MQKQIVCKELKKYFVLNEEGMDGMVAVSFLTNLCSKCTEITVEMTNSANRMSPSFLMALAPILRHLNDSEAALERMEFENVANECSDKECKKFKAYLGSNRLSNWTLSIQKMDGDRHRYKDKFQYTLQRKVEPKSSKKKTSLVHKMKHMFKAQK